LVAKEETLKELEATIQETKKSPSITTIESNTMIEEIMVNSPSNMLSQETFGVFENHTIGIGSKIMRKMVYDGQGIGKEIQGILIPIVAQL
jgi:hypothetical protein